jgi:hypothetical protein
MLHVDTPWIGLAALIAMFVIPFLPRWFFEGPRTIKHWPRRHICGECGTSWSNGHSCLPDVGQIELPLNGQLRRPGNMPNALDLTTLRRDQLSLPSSREE